MNSEIYAFHRLEHHFFTMVSVNKIDYGHIIAFTTGVKAPGLNPAFIQKIDEYIQHPLAACSADYKKNQTPWTLVIPDYLFNQHLEHELEARQFSEQDIGFAMIVELDNYCIASSQVNLQCKLMRDNLATWSIPLIGGFNSTPEITSVYTQQHQQALSHTQSIYHFSGFHEDQIVCSLTLSLHHNTARIDDVATLPAYQRLGFATRLIHEAILFARQRHIKKCFLEASNEGLTLYQRLGFKQLFKNYYYELLSDLS